MALNKFKIFSSIMTLPYILIDKSIKKQPSRQLKEKNLLLIFLGEIGDYILFRNFIEEIKKDKAYSDYSITLLGNQLWKGISENLDKKYVDSFIWIDKKKFTKNLSYRKKILQELHKNSFEIALHPSYGRFFSLESLINCSNAKRKIGNRGGSHGMYFWQRSISNRYYTNLISTTPHVEFEFLKNKDFFEKFLHKKLSTKLSINSLKKNSSSKYISLVPGAGAKFRRWSPKNFAKVADFLIKNKKLKIMISGSKTDSKLAQEIISHSKFPSQILDQTGNTLLQSIDLIGNSKFIITNDTGMVHIAAATKTPAFCISNGNQYGKFHPYPASISKIITYIYPKSFSSLSNEELIKKYNLHSTEDINQISSDDVIKKLKARLASR